MSTRTDRVGQAALLWINRHERLSRLDYQDFLNDPASLVDEEQASEDEAITALAWLISRELVTGVEVYNSEIPVGLELTNDGRVCVIEYDGDVRAWAQAQLGGGHVDQSVNVTGHNAQVAAYSQHVKQSQVVGEVDVDKLRSAATMTLETLPVYSLPAEQAVVVKQAAEQIVAETQSPTPDHGKLRQLADTVKTWLAVASTGATTAGAIIADIQAATGH